MTWFLRARRSSWRGSARRAAGRSDGMIGSMISGYIYGWLVVTGCHFFCHQFYFPRNIGNVIIPMLNTPKETMFYVTGWWWLVAINFIFPEILGMSNHPNWRTHIFQRGWNHHHQPDGIWYPKEYQTMVGIYLLVFLFRLLMFRYPNCPKMGVPPNMVGLEWNIPLKMDDDQG